MMTVSNLLILKYEKQKSVEESTPKENEEKLSLFQTPHVIGKFLRGWQMDMPDGNYLESDPRIFLNNIRPQIFSKLEEELKKLNSLKFQLALKVFFYQK